MAARIADPEVQVLAAISATLQADYTVEELAWNGSPFAWIRSRPSRQRGAIGEQLVAAWLAAKGFDVVRAPDSESDRLVNNRRTEIKFSTLWGSGVYKFQQIRDQRYDIAICLGISPFDAHCWAIPKKELMRRWKARDGIHGQHSGRGGRDTAWLSVEIKDPPPWLEKYGGRLQDAVRVISDLVGPPASGR